jgi:uncharacterized membrane protein
MTPSEALFRDIALKSSDIRIRRIAVADLWQALRQGYEDFNEKPSFGFFVVLIYPLIALLVSWFAVGENTGELAFPVLAGLTLLGPVASVALFAMSRRRELGLALEWRAAFDFIHSSSFAPIAALSVVMALLYGAWLYMAQFIYTGLFGADPPDSFTALLTEVATTRRGEALAFYGCGVGAIFALTAFSISVFAFPLLLDKPATTLTAIVTSLRAVTANPVAMLVWAATVVVLLALGAALLLIGLAAVLPILGHATWHLYRKVVES